MQTLALLYVFGKEVWEPPYHVTIIRSVLTQHIASMFGDIHDEMESAFAELVHVSEDGVYSGSRRMSSCHTEFPVEWTPLPAAAIVRELVARISGRAFVGLPYCQFLSVSSRDLSHRQAQAVIQLTLTSLSTFRRDFLNCIYSSQCRPRRSNRQFTFGLSALEPLP